MKKITQEELNEKIELHRLWLNDSDEGERLVLRGFDLRGLDLMFANLENADLSNSDLSYSFLEYSNLRFVDLIETILIEADLTGSDLSYTNLAYADLTDALLINTNLYYSNLNECKMVGSTLSKANTNHVLGMEIYSIDNVGTFNGKATYIPSLDKVFAGCWEGGLEEFLVKGLEMNKENKKEMKNIKLAYEFFKNNKEE